MMGSIRAFISLVFGIVALPVQACIVAVAQDPNDLKYADVVVVGRIEKYEIVRDMEFRETMLSNPKLSEDLRKIYEDPNKGLLSDYARFDVQVDEVLRGEVPPRFKATWDNSTFGEPDRASSQPLIIAFRKSTSPIPPLRGSSATVLPNPEPETLTVLQAPCAGAFIFSSSPEALQKVRAILLTKP